MPILSHRIVTAPGSTPIRWVYFLHGIYGMGRNWATVARRFVEQRPEFGAVLVDLRKHGGSQDFVPPHTLAAAAQDLAGLATELGRPVDTLVAHSFGGKVALVYARAHARGLQRVFVVDSTPAAGAPGGSAWTMLAALRAAPGPFATRNDAIAALEQQGVSNPVAQWVSTNLAERAGGYAWNLDLDSLEALLLDFFQTDAQDLLDHPPAGVTLHFIKATESSILNAQTAARIHAASATGSVLLHEVEGGHWLNADNPDAIVQLLVEHTQSDAQPAQ